MLRSDAWFNDCCIPSSSRRIHAVFAPNAWQTESFDKDCRCASRQCRVLGEAHLQSLSKDSVCHAFGAKTAWILLDEEGIQQSLNQASDLNLNLPVTSRHWVYVL